MSSMEHQVKKAQHRLWFNRWLRQWGWSALFAAAAWTIAWLVDRLFFPGVLPIGWSAITALGLSVVASLIWLLLTREHALLAATALDKAAGLRERISTGLYIQPQAADPFAKAVVADAERAIAGLSARRFIPIRWASSLSFSSVMIAVALLSLLLPEIDLLGNKEALAAENERLSRLERVQSIVAKPVSVMRQIEEKHPDLELGRERKKIDDALRRDRQNDPNVLRRETVKKLDRLQDALKQKANADRFKALNETKKRLKQLGQPSDPKTELGKLLDSLSSGDFQEAQEAVKKLKENLAKRTRDGKIDAKAAKQMQKQLEDMAKKLQQAAEDKQSKRELQNAGLSEADAKRILEELSKKDPKQIEELAKKLSQQLKDKGISQQQMQKMLQKIQQRQQACKQCQKLGQKMDGAAKQMQQGNTQAAQDELGEAGEMLNEMEQLEQAMNELNAQMSQLDDARDDLNDEGFDKSDKCKHCNGTGFLPDGSPCPWCDGSGRCGGMGGGGGKLPRDDSAQTDTVDKKAKIKTRSGSIIGQKFVKGRQLKGASDVEFYDAATAAEIDATDSLNKDRIPRLYRKGVKRYFDRLGNSVRPADKADSASDKEEPKADGDKSDTPNKTEEPES